MSCILGVTIGPLWKTFQEARSTREYAVVSLLYSKLAEQFVREMSRSNQLLTPVQIEYASNFGLYPDRVFWICPTEVGEVSLNELKDLVINNIERQLPIHPDNLKLNDFIRIYIAQVEIDTSLQPSDEKPLKKVNAMLDMFELQEKQLQRSLKDLVKWLIAKDIAPTEKRPVYNWRLNSDAAYFRNYNHVKRYPSAIEIAGAPLFYSNRDSYDYNLAVSFSDKNTNQTLPGPAKLILSEDTFFDNDKQYKILECLKSEAKSNSIQFLALHKYYCIVFADGDNIGKYLNNNLDSTTDELKPISNNLVKASFAAAQLIETYGGVPVYIGGDDLLFFAPVTSVEDPKATILTLCNQLDKSFQDIVNIKDLSLSFGISVGYHKFPMDILHAKSIDNLMNYAKYSEGKNTIALTLIKHSGSAFNLLIGLKDKEYELLTLLINQVNDEDESLLRSIAYKLKKQHEVLLQIKHDRNRIICFFKNNFNKRIHEKHEMYFRILADLIVKVYSNPDLNNAEIKIFDLLKFIHFLHEKENNG